MHNGPLRSAPLAAVIGLALVGAGTSGMLLENHAGGWEASGQGTGYMLRLCETPVFPSASCAGVVDGRWGSFDVYLGSRRIYVPTSLIGLMYFLALAVWFAMVGHLPASERWLWRLTLLVVSFGLGGSLFFTGLMAFVLSAWCLPCLIIHLLNGGVFLCTLWLWRRARRMPEANTATSPQDAAYRPRYQRERAAWAVAVATGASVSVWLYFDSMTEVRRQWRKAHDLAQIVWALQNDRSIVLHEYFEQPFAEIPQNVADMANVETIASGPVHRVIVFTGYDCHGCKCFEPSRRKMIEAAFSGQVRVDYRYLPTTPENAPPTAVETTNASVRRVKDAWTAALAVEAARRQGPEAFTKMHALLLKHRDEHPHPGCKELARRAGLDVGRFEADLTSRAVRQQAEWNMDLAAGLGVSSLPAVFLDGRQVPDLCITSHVFWSAIAEALAEGPVPETASAVVATR